MVVRAFKAGSLLLAIGGVVVLLFAASRTQVPPVEIGNLIGTMNWAYVHVEGVVTRQPALEQGSGTLRFWLWDGTGEILVIAYRSEVEELLDGGLVPVMGDSVSLEGTLRIKDDFQYLILDVPRNTEIRPVELVRLPIDRVDLGLLYQPVTIRGVVRDDRSPYQGLRILTLRDDSGQIDVTVATGPDALLGDLPELGIGMPVQVTGAVDLYKGMPQISVGRGTDLVVLDEDLAVAPRRQLGHLSSRDVGDMALVEGTIVRADPFSAGTKFTLDDGTGTVTALLWQDLHDSLVDGEQLVVGTRLQVLGEVAEYRDELELIPQIPSDITVKATGESVTSTRKLGDLRPEDTGRMVAVQGVLRSLQTFSAGVKGTLEDDTGTVTLLLWQDLYDDLPDQARLAPGAVLEVQGEVAQYQGNLEIVPQSPADLVVAGLVALPTDRRTIDRVTASDVGQRLEVSGRVVDADPFSKGLRYTLDDGTGTLTLLIWQNLYERLPDANLLAMGTEVMVQGEVVEYWGELEIVPQMPADVWVIAPAAAAMSVPTTVPTPFSPVGSPSPAVTLAVESLVSPAVTGAVEPPVQTPEVPLQPTPSSTPKVTLVPVFETRAIGTISGEDIGRTLRIARAGITEVDYFSAGVKYTLVDDTGHILLLLWQNVLEGIPNRYDLVPGSQVEITGSIDEFAGELEIIPGNGTGLSVLSKGQHLPIEERPASKVTASDEGRIFTLEGVVNRTEHSGWLKLWLSDGTGEILIFVPERTVRFLPSGIGNGVSLRVTGEVDIYQDVIEIIPLAGADVEVQGP
jgi:DNA/RNA endonuclease YhcR with UshA esterase domain